MKYFIVAAALCAAAMLAYFEYCEHPVEVPASTPVEAVPQQEAPPKDPEDYKSGPNLYRYDVDGGVSWAS